MSLDRSNATLGNINKEIEWKRKPLFEIRIYNSKESLKMIKSVQNEIVKKLMEKVIENRSKKHNYKTC